MQKRLLFKIGYVCKIHWWWGGEQGHFWPAVCYTLFLHRFSFIICEIVIVILILQISGEEKL